MRLLVFMLCVPVFIALWFLDTTGLMRLGWYCLAGNCGVSTPLIAMGAALLGLGFFLAQGRGAPDAKPRVVKNVARPKRASGRAIATRGSAPPASRRRPRPKSDR